MRNIDPRTHLVVLFAVSILISLYDHQWQFDVLFIFGACYMILNGLWKKAISAVVIYVAMLLLLKIVPNIFPAMAVFLFITTRVFPMFMVGTVLVLVPGSRILYTLDYMKVPKPILILIMVFLRFLPMILKEIQIIYQGIKVRSIFPTPLDLLKKPLVAYECIVVPLMFRCLKLSSELAAAAEIRGIECNRKRTTVYTTTFDATDFTAMLSGCIAFSIYLVGGRVL